MVSPEQISASKAAGRLPTPEWQVIEIKGHIRDSSEPYVPMTGNAPIPAEKRDC
jgi:hypothetical protein